MTLDFAKLHQDLVDAGLAPADQRVYLVIDLANAVLQGAVITPEHRKKLADFPYTLELLDHMATRRGTLTRISASPGPNATAETFAKGWLAVEWEVAHAHTWPVTQFEKPWGWKTDVRTMRRSFHVDWKHIPAWLRDGIRGAATTLRVIRDRKLLRLVNPYEG